jgi:hypothetical protein
MELNDKARLDLKFKYEVGKTNILALGRKELITDQDVIEIVVGNVQEEDGYTPEEFEIAITFTNNEKNGMDLRVNCQPNSTIKNAIKKVVSNTDILNVIDATVVFISCEFKAEIAVKVY